MAAFVLKVFKSQILFEYCMSGVNFLNKIDAVLKDQNKTRKSLCEKLSLLQGTMATWKTKNIMPHIYTIYKISKELMVSVDWLISDDIDFELHDGLMKELSRKAVRKRIYTALGNKYKNEDTRFSDNYLDDELLLKELHKFYFEGGYACYEELYNWSKGRCELDQKLFHQWAQNLNTTLQYIITGGEIIFSTEQNQIENDLYELAIEFKNELSCLHRYSPERLLLAKNILNELICLERLQMSFKDSS